VLASQFRRNFASGLPSTAVNVALAAAGYAIYLNYLGYQRFGLWLVLGLVMSETQIFKAGLSPAQVKLVAETYAKGDLAGVRDYIGSSQLVLLLFTLPLPAAVFALRHTLVAFFRFDGADAAVFLQLIGPMMLFLIYILIVDAMVSSLGGVGRMDLTNYLVALTQGVGLIVGTVLLHAGYGVTGLLIAQILGYVVLHVGSFLILRRICHFRFRDQLRWRSECVRNLVRTGSWLFGSTLVNLLLDPLNRVLLTRYAGLASVPQYDIALNAGMKLRSFAEVATRSISPEVARIAAIGGEEAATRIARIERRALLIVLGGCLVTFVLIGIFAGPFLHLLLRARYSDALLGPVRAMLLAAFFSAGALPAFYVLTGLGQTRQILTSLFCQSGVSVAVLALVFATSHHLTTLIVVLAYAAGTFTSAVYLNLVSRTVLRDRTFRSGTLALGDDRG
jgi:O-antigen/teichoic acid export membrane protein